jgi:transposase
MSKDATLLPDPTQLPDDTSALKELVVRLCGTVQEREERIRQLEQQMHLLVKRFLRPGSEKIDPRQLAMFREESEAEAPTTAPEPPPEAEPTKDKPRRKHTPHGRRRTPHTLERQILTHDLTDAQKLALGGQDHLECIGEDVTSNYEWKPASLLVIEHHQKKYVRTDDSNTDNANANNTSNANTDHTDSASAGNVNGAIVDNVNADHTGANNTNANCTDTDTANSAASGSVDANSEQSVASNSFTGLTPELAERFSSPVIVAPKPPQPIPGGLAGAGLLAQVIVNKYADHLPLYRLERIFARQGVIFTRQTMCDWCGNCAKLLTPLTELIRELVLLSFVIHTDDTPVDVRDAHAKQKIQARFWTYYGDSTHPLTWYEFTNTRKRAGPDRVLAKYTGYLQADGYGGYDGYEGVEISETNPILKVACWAHARRKFHDALSTEPKAAQTALSRIGQLYALEKTLRQRVAGEWRDLPLETRAALIAAERKEHAQPILNSIKTWLDQQQQFVLPKSPIATAIRYALNQWSALCRYVEDGRLSIDNNPAERALRGIAIGRNNWLFCGSEAGGRTAAVFFTLISSAVRNGVEPWAYLRDVLTRMAELRDIAAGGTREQLLSLLPDRWKPSPQPEPAGPVASQ